MSDYHRIATSVPVDSLALRQTLPGIEYGPTVKILDYWSDRPPIIHRQVGSDNWHDFTGRTFGRLTVIGLLEGKNTKRPSSWVCRCACGGYCSRTSKSLRVADRGGNTFQDRCGLCQYTEKLRDGVPPPKVAERHRFAKSSRMAITKGQK